VRLVEPWNPAAGLNQAGKKQIKKKCFSAYYYLKGTYFSKIKS
jgi:hypothetical protein